MPTIPCESKLQYTYNGSEQSGTGRTEKDAEKEALNTFATDAAEQAARVALGDAGTYQCNGDQCRAMIALEGAVFKKTKVVQGANAVTVTVQIQVPVTVSCKKPKVTVARLEQVAFDIRRPELVSDGDLVPVLIGDDIERIERPIVDEFELISPDGRVRGTVAFERGLTRAER